MPSSSKINLILQKQLYSELNMNQYSTSSPTQSTSSEIMVSSALQPLPPPPPQTQLPLNYGDSWPPNETGIPPLCAGCRLRIEDKYYLSAVDVKWHSKCLKCAECGVELEQAASCFEKDGLIFCKEDYLRYGLRINFPTKLVSKCDASKCS